MSTSRGIIRYGLAGSCGLEVLETLGYCRHKAELARRQLHIPID